MDYKIIEQLIKTMSQSDLSTLELQSDEFTIRMSKGSIGFKDNSIQTSVAAAPVAVPVQTTQATVVETVATPAPAVVEAAPVVTGGNVVASPMVGTFYSSAAPEKPAYVSVGTAVKKGTVLCIVEAMKLMNEIESEFDGEVVEILVNNGDMVEYGQPLFRIK